MATELIYHEAVVEAVNIDAAWAISYVLDIDKFEEVGGDWRIDGIDEPFKQVVASEQ